MFSKSNTHILSLLLKIAKLKAVQNSQSCSYLVNYKLYNLHFLHNCFLLSTIHANDVFYITWECLVNKLHRLNSL